MPFGRNVRKAEIPKLNELAGMVLDEIGLHFEDLKNPAKAHELEWIPFEHRDGVTITSIQPDYAFGLLVIAGVHFKRGSNGANQGHIRARVTITITGYDLDRNPDEGQRYGLMQAKLESAIMAMEDLLTNDAEGFMTPAEVEAHDAAEHAKLEWMARGG